MKDMKVKVTVTNTIMNMTWCLIMTLCIMVIITNMEDAISTPDMKVGARFCLRYFITSHKSPMVI